MLKPDLPRLPGSHSQSAAFAPMIPVASSAIPQGPGWVHQLKWDGVRIVATLEGRGDGQPSTVTLSSRSGLIKNAVYPEVAAFLTGCAAELGSCVLDGELVYWNGERPVFQLLLRRERGAAELVTDVQIAVPAAGLQGRPQPDSKPHPLPPDLPPSLLYVVFDLLADHGEDLRSLPYEERHKRLVAKLGMRWAPAMFVPEWHWDSGALWAWVEANRWEGIVSKRLASSYKAGKSHQDWLKTKIRLILYVDIVGIKLREGRVASLVMSLNGDYLGSVSLGLDEQMKRLLMDKLVAPLLQKGAAFPQPVPAESTLRPGAAANLGFSPMHPPPFPLPADLMKETVVWLPISFPCSVTGLEITAAGQLRHPKLVGFGAAT